MKVAGEWLTASGTQRLMAALAAHGAKALFVGGCVRNALLGVPVVDIDIATDALPETVMRMAQDAGFRHVPTGLDHGTLTVIAEGVAHEVTTFRRDVQTDGRRAVVAFSGHVSDDAARRDFTMNALYAQADGTVIDPLNGLDDLLARRVRFVGDAESRITEDYLRILRFFRFYAAYGDPTLGIDAAGLAACAAHSAGIDTLSRERVGAEMRKLLSATDPGPALAAMQAAGVLARVLPGASARAIPVLVHLEAGAPRNWLCRLAVLGGEAADLRLSRADTAKLAILRAEIGSTAQADALGYLHGAAIAGDILHSRAAMFESPLPDAWAADLLRGSMAEFPVAAADLMPSLQGAALGAKLAELKARWLSTGLKLTRTQLLA